MVVYLDALKATIMSCRISLRLSWKYNQCKAKVLAILQDGNIVNTRFFRLISRWFVIMTDSYVAVTALVSMTVSL